MRQYVLMFLFDLCVVNVFLRAPIKWAAARLATWGEPEIEKCYCPSGYVEGGWMKDREAMRG